MSDSVQAKIKHRFNLLSVITHHFGLTTLFNIELFWHDNDTKDCTGYKSQTALYHGSLYHFSESNAEMKEKKCSSQL